MTRAIFKKGQIDKFITDCKSSVNLTLPQLAHVIKVSRHTLNDWRREELLPNLEKLLELAKYCHTSLPSILSTKPDNWGSSLAGYIKNAKYGCNLTHKDRSKGGNNSQVVRKIYPDYYRKLGCNMRNEFIYPIHTTRFAELIGILLGDGHIGNNGQFSITLNSVADKEYVLYVISLLKSLFNYNPSIHPHKNSKAITIYCSGKNLIDFLLNSGMKIGNKVKQQVDVPGWIKLDPELSRWCLRGLMDTDGGIFTNAYIKNGKSYIYPKTNFTNASQPLLDFVYKTLLSNNFHPNNNMPRKIWLYSQEESKRYLEVIGSSNPRLLNKVQ